MLQRGETSHSSLFVSRDGPQEFKLHITCLNGMGEQQRKIFACSVGLNEATFTEVPIS
jgi:hypothetical protein